MEKLRTIVADIILNLIGGLFGLAGLITTLPGLILIFAICGEWHLKEAR